jgi:hypothetical protein
MKIEEQLAKLYLEENKDEFTSLITKAYIDGYNHGLKKAREIDIDGLKYYDLGLPSGTLWSNPICVKHQYTYVTYDRVSYLDVSDLQLPSVKDVDELIQNCMVTMDSLNIANDVVITGPNGVAISIGTKDYRNNPSNPNSILCRRQGQEVPEFTNMFWMKSDPIDNQTLVGLVDYNNKSLSMSTHFTGYKLPYLLVKKPK